MESLIIKIDWPQFIGVIVVVVGFFVVLAWKGSGRFNGIEKDITWLKDGLKDLKDDVKNILTENANKKVKAFESQSPIRLTQIGEKLLEESGLKNYIDEHRDSLFAVCGIDKYENAYELQQGVFEYFDNMQFESDFDNKIKQYAFDHGVQLDILKRIGAIYYRDICLERRNFNKADLDASSTNS